MSLFSAAVRRRMCVSLYQCAFLHHTELPNLSQAALAALNSILLGAVKYGVEESVLSAELQQLGLPKENGDAVARHDAFPVVFLSVPAPNTRALSPPHSCFSTCTPPVPPLPSSVRATF